MKKLFLLIAAVITMTTAHANQFGDSDKGSDFSDQVFQPITPSYMDGVFIDEGWKSNWFLSVQGGFSAFIGTPVGCEDFFGRLKPVVHASIGKWVTPHVGGRVSYQGFQLLDSDIKSRNYQSVHADLLYNVTSHFRYDPEMLPKWDCIPYLGVGIIRNAYTHHKPFAFSYGVIGRYRIADRWHLTAEIGGTTTFQDFDGYGKSNAFGDNLLQASIGFTTTIGKNGWKRVIDPMPYIYQNDVLLEYISRCALAERQKIYTIQQDLEVEDTVGEKRQPKNNYSGLNALRERLKNRNQWVGEAMFDDPVIAKEDSSFVDKYLTFLQEGQEQVGAPVFFFFQLNTTVLTDAVQAVNIEAIAKVMNLYNLYAHIIGAADSHTGNAERNQLLGQSRAEYIANELVKKYNIDAQRISLYNEGGTNKYKPFTANRNACVILYKNK